MAKPLVSVVLPTYNRASTLARAIRSVLEQSYENLELLIVDDGSSDETPQIVSSFSDPRLKYIPLGQNRGASAARNTGIEAASGEWVAFQDSDDEWLPTKLESQLKCAEHPDEPLDMVLGSYIVNDPQQPRFVIQPASVLQGDDALADILDGWPIITPTWLLRRELLERVGGFDESYPCFEDWDLVFRLHTQGRVGAVSEPILIKHSSVDTICSDTQVRYDSLRRLVNHYADLWRRYPYRYARRLANLGLLEYQMGDRPLARKTFAQAVRVLPLHPVVHAYWLASHVGRLAVAVVRRLWPVFATMKPAKDCIRPIDSA